jgi:signal transduction histidine kinase
MNCFEHHIAPHQRSRLRDYLTKRLLGGPELIHYEYDALRKDGTLVTLDKIVRLVQWKGEVAVQDTVIDATARRRAEEHARKHEAELAHVARLISAEIRKKGIRMELDLGPDLPVVNGSLVQLEQVALNLICSAFEAIEEAEHGPRNVITLRTIGNRRTELKLTVRDTAVGLDPAIALRVLEAFVTTKHDGLGLGLSISRTIVDAHGGRLWATSNESGGTTFHLTLPTLAFIDAY